MDYSKVEGIKVTKSCEFNVEDYTFQVEWDNNFEYDINNDRYYGGISSMKIYSDRYLLDTIFDIEDGIGLGNIRFRFYDYNFDGHIDFTVPISCGKTCYVKYYLFNPTENKFQHYKSWDHLNIQKINKKEKQILSDLEGTLTDGWQILYQVKGSELMELKTFTYGDFFRDLEK